ncbi:MAG: hypothetical protein ACE5HQ_11130 [Gemmatimonadota bacterium]
MPETNARRLLSRSLLEMGIVIVSILVATVPDTLLIPLMIAPTTDLGLGTLDGLRTSGGIQDLRNAALRLELGRWQGVFDEAREEDDRSRRLVTEQVGPVLRRYIDMAGIWTAGFSWLEGRLTSEQPAGMSDLPANNEVLGVIAERLIYLNVGQGEFNAVSAELDRILGLLDSGIAELR